MRLDTRDLIEIQMLRALYGHVVDERDWSAMDQVRSKHLGPRPGGLVFVTYHDVVRKTPNGWRLAERKALRRGPGGE